MTSNPNDSALTKYKQLQDAIRRKQACILDGAHRSATHLQVVIPTWQANSDDVQPATALHQLRLEAKLSQSDLAERVGTRQTYVARRERKLHPKGYSPPSVNLDTLEKWGKACGYDYRGMFVLADPADARGVLSRLSLTMVAIKYGIGGKVENLLQAFLTELRRESGADLVTCYLVAQDNGPSEDYACQLGPELVLVHKGGKFHDPDRLQGLIKAHNPPMKLRDGKAAIVDRPELDDVFSQSHFRVRERIAWLAYAPFSVGTQQGIVFLNFRHGGEPRQTRHELLVKQLPSMLNYLCCAEASEIQTQSRLDDPALSRLLRKITENGPASIAFELPRTVAQLKLFANKQLHWSLYLRNKKTDAYCSTAYLLNGNVHPVPHTIPPTSKGIIAGVGDTGTCCMVNNLAERKARGDYENLPGCEQSQSELAVPLINLNGHSIGVLNVESRELNAFTTQHALFLERAAQSLFVAWETHKRFNKKDHLKSSVAAFLDKINCAASAHDKIRAIAELALAFFQADVVDIWMFDPKNRKFHPEDGAHAVSGEFAKSYQGSPEVDELYVWLPRPSGNSMSLINDPDLDVIVIEDSSKESNKYVSVAEKTIKRGIRSLIGVPIKTNNGMRPDGVVWIRFLQPQKDSLALRDDAKLFASVIHLLWNPLRNNMDVIPQVASL